jgi:glycosyltransferase involved in cell wall biosynthesis
MRQAHGPIRVLIFSRDVSGGGGVVNFLELLKHELSAEIETEHFLVGQRPGKRGALFRPLLPLYDALALAASLAHQNHDVYHLNPSLVPRSTWRDGLFLLVLRIFRRRNTLVFFRGWDPDYYDHISRSRLLRYLFRFSYSGAARFLVLAKRFADQLEALGFPPAAIHVVTTMFDGRLLRVTRRQRVDDCVRILFLARLVAGKGIHELIEGFRKARLQNPKLELIIAGDGPEAQRAQASCRQLDLENHVRFVGYVRTQEKAQLLVDSDIFVLPSYYNEGCPNALLEAMGAGLPVVVTPVGGIPDIVEDTVNGVVLSRCDVDLIASALLQLGGDEALRNAMGERNRTTAWARYEAKVVTASIEAHYRDIAASSSFRGLAPRVRQ